MKILVILFLVFIVGSLVSALYFLVTGRGRSDRMARALTVRVALSVVLFALLMLGYYFGFITGKTLKPASGEKRRTLGARCSDRGLPLLLSGCSCCSSVLLPFLPYSQ